MTIPAAIIEQHTYLTFKGSDERLPKQNTAAPNKWAFEVLPAQAGNTLTLRVRSQAPTTATLCVWIRDTQNGWHNSCTDNVDIGEKSVQITKTTPPTPAGTPVAVVDWSPDTTMYYWSDGTQSGFSHDDNAFFRGVHEFDEQGFRSSDAGATGSWPTDRQLAGAEGLMLFWDNKTFQYFTDGAGNFVLDLTQDPLSLSELGKGGNQPDWSNKRLVGVAEAWEWRAFFWHDGTHSLYHIANDYWDFRGSEGLSTGFRSNATYDIPNDKRISAVEAIEDKKNQFRIFWFDGTHSESRGSNLTKNTDGFDEHGYRSNKALPDWPTPTPPPPPPTTPIAVVDFNSDITSYYWSDGTQSQFSHYHNAFFRNLNGFDAQGFRPSDSYATGSWPTDRQLAGAEGRMLFWDNKTFHYFLDESGNFVLDLTQDPLPLSELGKGKPQPDWSNKQLVGVAKTWQSLLFFWHDGTHSTYIPLGNYWEFYGQDTGFSPNKLYRIPSGKRISAVEAIGDKKNAFRIFWLDDTHSEARCYSLTKNTDGFDEHGYRSNNALPDWAR
ncbi:hypothetical protein L1D31_18070 [Vibrio sp. Isolate23]|uniref:hypothetical protein n=1 Tax=Vibrio sp. Isolate23 TaxID=2908533 RepID=UPI001EFE01EE|nr:hypothetical protein [Vibrio sp. Isolate23]MCG9684445.1 hypothetical protein [Vibrio sp. Isolate23]